MKFNVFNGEYPFDTKLGEVDANTPENALAAAITKFRTVDHPHPVVEPVDKHQEQYNGHGAYH